MKILGILLISVVCSATVILADIKSCPSSCTCVLDGTSGVSASCTQFKADEQHFNDTVQHLTISNKDKSSLSLTDNIFVKLGLQRVESVKIVNSSLTEISVKAFQNLSSLFEVNLSDNQLFLIHADTFAWNTNLHRLNLSGNPLQLTQLLETPHEYLLRSSSLTEFDMSNCQLSNILPTTFSQLKNLVFVNLAWNLIRVIPKEVFEGLEALEELDLSYNHIAKVEKDAFKFNKNLSVLKLKGNPITTMNGINATSLEELDLSECKLKILLKENIQGMPHLIALNLRSNVIEVFSDDTFNDLKELKTLDLSNNKITGPLPRDLYKNNQDLETLLLNGNKELGIFVEESGFIENHYAMLKLEIADCGLTNLTAGQLRGMDNLNILNVSDNAIRVLEENTFANLKRLNNLDLSNNKLETLPNDLFASNVELVKLSLRGNPLKHLSMQLFGHLSELKFLDASNCALEKLWSSHKHDESQKLLNKLAFFDISKNRLKSLHVYDFSTMDRLERIDLSENPIECIKPTIQLIEWFIAKEVDPSRQDAKIQENGKEEKVKWNEVIESICPVKQIEEVKKVDKVVHSNNGNVLPVVHTAQSSFTAVDEIVVEDTPLTSSVMWPTILAASILIVALYFIIYLVVEITHRRRAMAAAYSRPGSLGGHVRTRGASGSPLYYKLYEECSIPTQPVKTKKSYILDFSPIQTILKKGTYRIMKTNEVNV